MHALFARDAFTKLQIFSLYSWMAIVCAVALFPIPVVILAAKESEMELNSHYWSSPRRATWYVYGTFLGESITRKIQVGKAWATR